MLEKIEKANDIKKLKPQDLPQLAEEIRKFLIQKVSKTGGHLGSNLGVVELTIALHRELDFPKDKIIWDVGHQSYTHKILTGRKNEFDNLRSFKGMSGFPKREESDCDAFDTGHSTTSISAGVGYVRARDLKKEDYTVVAVIGDGSLTGGMAYEALNNAATLKSNYIIILNDNQMSISENVGGMSRYLANMRTGDFYIGLKKGVTNTLMQIPGVGEQMVTQIRRAKDSIKQLMVPGMLFEDMGITYLGPVPGHDIKRLTEVIRDAKRVEGPVMIHVMTTKGKGYLPAERQPAKFHGVGPFHISTGKPLKEKTVPTYTDIFGKAILKEAESHKDLVTITAAMADGTGLSRFQYRYPNRFFDVGIAEEHAVTFAAGLAAGGLKPVFAIYSSFLQRAYDQIVHDVAMQKLPVVFAVDRAGLVGNDGETHQGILDLSFLSNVPGMVLMSPKNAAELEAMVHFAVEYKEGPVALRYPRGSASFLDQDICQPVVCGKSEIIEREKEIAILSVGHMYDTAHKAWTILKEKGYACSLINARFVKPLDTKLLKDLEKDHKLVVTIEENVLSGGFGEHVAAYYGNIGSHVRTHAFAVPDCFVEHGNVDTLRKMIGLDVDSIVSEIEGLYQKEA